MNCNPKRISSIRCFYVKLVADVRQMEVAYIHAIKKAIEIFSVNTVDYTCRNENFNENCSIEIRFIESKVSITKSEIWYIYKFESWLQC